MWHNAIKQNVQLYHQNTTNDTIIQYNKNMLQFQINVTVWCVCGVVGLVENRKRIWVSWRSFIDLSIYQGPDFQKILEKILSLA